MSFTTKVKDEIIEHDDKSRHCMIAMFHAFLEIYGCDKTDSLYGIFTESLTVSSKCIILYRKVLKKEPDIIKSGHGVFIKLLPEEVKDISDRDSILKRECCKRAYLRAWFMAAGSVSDPGGRYHLEMVTDSREKALHLCDIIGTFDIEAKITQRKDSFVVYMKEGQRVVDFLNVIGAHVAMMEFENARILKDVRGNINRQVNCETANIKKTISASARQIKDIMLLRDTVGFSNLSDSLAQIARLRLEHPEVSLKELGEMSSPPIGKSGVNHRLRKLSEMADNIRKDS